MEKIGIFCSASENIDKMYFDSAKLIGRWLGEIGKTLIYGGASLGLMECVARAVKESGGRVVQEKGFARQPMSVYYDVARSLDELKKLI